jgi:DIM1 family U5 snRNP protein
MLTHLPSAWHVDKAILSEQERIVVMRFAKEEPTTTNQSTPTMAVTEAERQVCLQMDAVLEAAAPLVLNFAVVYAVDRWQVPDFDAMYELDDGEPVAVMFFWHGRHMLVDYGTGNNHKITWPLADKQDLIDVLEVVYKGAIKGKRMVVSPKDYSTRYKY